MGRKKSPHGYAASRFNRLKHGAMIHDILPSRGLDHCPLADGCPVAFEDDLRELCVPGQPCAWETWYHERFMFDGRGHYRRCLDWLTLAERDHILSELGLLHLRRIRVSALTAQEGLLRDKRHPVSGFVYGQEPALGVGRYSTAIDTLFWPLMEQLLYSREERAAMDAGVRREDKPLVLPSRLPARPSMPQQEPTPPARPYVDHTAGWFDLPRRWDHEPGKPKPEDT